AVGIKELRIGPEAHRGAGIAGPDCADGAEFGVHAAVAKADVVLASAPPDAALELPGERIDDRDPDAVQATGELVGAFGELAAGMQPREDQLHAADFL